MHNPHHQTGPRTLYFSSSEFVEILAAFCSAFHMFLWYSLDGRDISSIDLFLSGICLRKAHKTRVVPRLYSSRVHDSVSQSI